MQDIEIPEVVIPEEFEKIEGLRHAFAIAARTAELKKIEWPARAGSIDWDFRALTEAVIILATLDETSLRMRHHLRQLCVVAFIDTATEYHHKTENLNAKQWTHDTVARAFPKLPFPGHHDNLVEYTACKTLNWAPLSVQRLMAARTAAEGTVLLEEVRTLPSPELKELKEIVQAHAATTPPGNLPETLRKKRDAALEAILAL